MSPATESLTFLFTLSSILKNDLDKKPRSLPNFHEARYFTKDVPVLDRDIIAQNDKNDLITDFCKFLKGSVARILDENDGARLLCV